jgi:hypothetical protein
MVALVGGVFVKLELVRALAAQLGGCPRGEARKRRRVVVAVAVAVAVAVVVAVVVAVAVAVVVAVRYNGVSS